MAGRHLVSDIVYNEKTRWQEVSFEFQMWETISQNKYLFSAEIQMELLPRSTSTCKWISHEMAIILGPLSYLKEPCIRFQMKKLLNLRYDKLRESNQNDYVLDF